MINNPSADLSAETTRVTRAIWSAMQTQTANNAKNFITKMAKEETAAALEKGVDVGEFAVGVRGLHTESKQDHVFFFITGEIFSLCTKALSHPSFFYS